MALISHHPYALGPETVKKDRCHCHSKQCSRRQARMQPLLIYRQPDRVFLAELSVPAKPAHR